MATRTATRQITSPNLNLPKKNSANPPSFSWAGWCLKYVNDGVNSPARQARAIYSYNIEKRNGNIRTGELPVGVRVPIYLSFTKGAYVGYGHVAWALRNANGSIEIHDSEVQQGSRGVYRSIAELLRWFGAYAPQYLGYSLWLDGRQVAEEYQEQIPEAPAPAPAPAAPAQDGTPSYKVKSGDTLGQIILNLGWNTKAGLWGANGDVARIAKANGIANPNLIQVGQVIKKA